MNNKLRRISIASLLSVYAIALSGCLFEMGDPVDDPVAAAAPPPPPAAANGAPVISGAPATMVLMSSEYAFTPTASDPDNDTLTFSVQNRPIWAQFDSTTGELTGTPLLGDVGTYPNIVLSVSDGSLSSSLPGFSVDVIQNANGSITLSWTAPTQNEDGTALTNLAAYKFYYGTSSGIYPDQVRVNNPGITSFVIENLPPATYYLVATAVNSSGTESRYSNEATKQVL